MGYYIFFVLKNCLKNTNNSVFTTVEPFSQRSQHWEISQSLVAVSKEEQEYSRKSQSQNTSAPGITEEYIAQVSEEIEGRVAEKLSQEFHRTESRIFGALSKLDNFLLNPQVRTFSGTFPGTFRNADVENQEPSGDHSQKDPHPEVEFSACRTRSRTDSEPDETSRSSWGSDNEVHDSNPTATRFSSKLFSFYCTRKC